MGKKALITDITGQDGSYLAELTGFDGEIRCDISKPDGQPRRCLDVSKAKKEFGFEAKVDLREGLERMIGWYRTRDAI